MTRPTGQLAIKDIAALADVSRAAVSNWRARYDDFPQPTPNSPARRPFFDLQEVISWLKSKGFFSKDSEIKQATIALTAAANELRAAHFDAIPAAILALYLLALKKQADESQEASGWQQVKVSTTANDLIESLKQASAPAGLDSADILPWESINQLLSDESTINLLAGIRHSDSIEYSSAAEVIIDAFLGLGGRGEISLYGSTNSLSSKLLSAAAATTTAASDTVFDPACGIGGTLIDLSTKVGGLTLIGSDISGEPLAIAKLHTYLANIDSIFTKADSLAHDPQPKATFNTIVCEPPLGARVEADVTKRLLANAGLDVPTPRHTDESFLIYVAAHLAAGGYGYVLTTVGAGYQRNLAQLRQTLVAHGAVEAVIQMPAGVLSYSRISTLLWVLRGPQDTPDTSVHILDATDTKPTEVEIARWLEDFRAKREPSIPARRIELAELITHNGDLTPSRLLKKEPKSEDVADSLQSSLTQLEASIKQIQQLHIDKTRLLTHTPIATQHVTLQQLIASGAITRYRGHSRPLKTDEIAEGPEALLVPMRDKGNAPESVTAAPKTRWLQDGDILVPDIAAIPARVFTGEAHKWVAPLGMTVLDVTDPELDAHYLAACVNASFNKAVDLGRILPTRDFNYIEVPSIDIHNQQQVVETLSQFEQMRLKTDAVSRQIKDTTDALLNVLRYGNRTR